MTAPTSALTASTACRTPTAVEVRRAGTTSDHLHRRRGPPEYARPLSPAALRISLPPTSPVSGRLAARSGVIKGFWLLAEHLASPEASTACSSYHPIDQNSALQKSQRRPAHLDLVEPNPTLRLALNGSAVPTSADGSRRTGRDVSRPTSLHLDRTSAAAEQACAAGEQGDRQDGEEGPPLIVQRAASGRAAPASAERWNGLGAFHRPAAPGCDPGIASPSRPMGDRGHGPRRGYWPGPGWPCWRGPTSVSSACARSPAGWCWWARRCCWSGRRGWREGSTGRRGAGRPGNRCGGRPQGLFGEAIAPKKV